MRRLVPPALAAALLLSIPAAAPAAEKVSDPTASEAVKAISSGAGDRRQRRSAARRRGGRVRLAWPRDRAEQAPDYPLTRWMARQVGPETAASGSAARARAAGRQPSTVDFLGGRTTGRLSLIRSFDIPATDAAHDRLKNLSWTYDNGLAAIAFIDAGEKTQAEQLLDQLVAVQRTDGAFDFAYDVSTGRGSGLVRTGALAWAGIAATYYRRTYGSTRYDALIAGVAKYLLDLRTSAGLVKGGPDVSWVSTQHNLLTVALLRDLVSSLKSKSAASSLGLSSTTLNSAQTTMGNAIVSNLLVQSGSTAYFTQGIGDTRIPVDVQSLGGMYLKLRGDSRAAQVGNYLSANFGAQPRIAPGLGNAYVFGARPFNAAGSPDIVWAEGTIQAKIALQRIGLSTSYAAYAVANLALLTDSFTKAPPQADQNIVTGDLSWGEYHTWPASAAASWMVMLTAGEGDQLFTK
jgi:hypothetical protein